MLLTNRHTLCRRFCCLLLLAALWLCGRVAAQPNPQYAHGYEFSFGLDASLWINLTDYHEMDPVARTTELEDFGFSFYFFDHAYRSFAINSQGGIRFGTRYPDRYRDVQTPFPSSFRGAYRWQYHTPYIIPFGMSLYQGEGAYSRWGVVGEPGQRKAVCEFNMSRNDSVPALYRFQVQLSEADGSVLYLYRYVVDTNSVSVYGNIGMAYDPYHFITINQNTGFCSAEVELADNETPNLATIWPQGNIRYYRLKPDYPRICANPARLIPRNVRQTTAEVVWRRNPLDDYYIFEYGTTMHYDDDWVTDTLGNPIRLARVPFSRSTTDTVLRLSGLRPGIAYEVRVATVCRNGDTSSPQRVTLYTYSDRERDNQFDYANIYAAHVTVGNGKGSVNEYYPHRYDDRYDHGPADGRSRQTVCSDTNGRDPETNYGLRYVSPEFSHAVKLGDTNAGALTESVTYALDVDTLDYDLLLLHYAPVEQSPEHEDPPKIVIEFLDSAGNLTDPCNRVDILAGQFGNEPWLRGVLRWVSYDRVYTEFKQWSKIGLDLGPFHGQKIKVRVTNYDCGYGPHYGYCYYAIESGTKHMSTTTCSSSSDMVFRAPEGFVYRWYRIDSPSVTLSTADTLQVHQAGWYGCWVGFRHDPTCGFEIRGYAGPRSPVAAFHADRLDSCGRRYRFINESYVAQDENGTPLPGSTPEEYLWRFDDGTTSTAPNPVHEFGEGTHTVALLALVGDGECRDSVSATVTMAPSQVVRYDTVCEGGRYPFHDTILSTAGTYIYHYDCTREELHLTTYKPFVELHDDTVCRGDGITVRGRYFDDSEPHTFAIPGPYSCDSTYHINLTIREWPEPEIGIAQTCHGDAYYTITLTPGWSYSWNSEPFDYETSTLEGLSTVRLNPRKATVYMVGFSYSDAPFCTVERQFSLTPVSKVSADIDVAPPILDLDHRSFVATDASSFSMGRWWFLEGEQLADTGRTITYELASDNSLDSVRLMLVAYNTSCFDTARRAIPIYRYQLLFPNIITPGQGLNETFLPSGYGISDYELWIYDRRGRLMFHTDDMQQPWDGTAHGQRCPQGSYAYVAHYTISTGERKQQAGTVTLVR